MYQIRILKYVHVYRQKIVALLEFDFDLRLETPTQTALGGDRVTKIRNRLTNKWAI